MRLDVDESLERPRSSHVVDRIRKLAIAATRQVIHRQVPLVTCPARIGDRLLDLIEHAPAESLERDRMELSKGLPV
jgi:hypothetical protein